MIAFWVKKQALAHPRLPEMPPYLVLEGVRNLTEKQMDLRNMRETLYNDVCGFDLATGQR